MADFSAPQDQYSHDLHYPPGPLRPTYGAEISVTVDGGSYTARLGEPLIDVINRSGTQLPQVCYHPQLGPIGTCDTCMVEVNGRVTRACTTSVAAGQSVKTAVAAANQAQREGYDRLMGRHDFYCTICDNNNHNCTLHNTLGLLRPEHQQHEYRPKGYAKDFSNPFYRYDPDQCILCGRCVEACQDVQVNETLSIDWSSPNPRVLWDGGVPINESSCVSCGHCVTVCPCNALMETAMLGEAGLMTDLPLPVWNAAVDVVKGVELSTGLQAIMAVSDIESKVRDGYINKTKTVCTYCGVGCSFDVWTKDRQILKVEPQEGAANGISTCVKGKFAWDYVNSDERLTSPLIREGERFREASWDEALDLVARRFSEIKAQYGPDALAFVASSKGTNEEAYLVQKFARQIIGTNNVDNCSRYCQSPATAGLFRTVGHGGDAGTIKDLEKAEMVICVGTNTAESHPVLATRIKRAHKLRGQQLIVVDLRKHEMARRADLFLRPLPGSDFIWLNAVSRFILDQGLAAEQFIAEKTTGLAEFKKSLEQYTLPYAAEQTGLSEAELENLARRIAAVKGGVCIAWAMGVTQQCGGSETSTAISNLLLITGNYARPGAGAYPLRGHNNVQGAADMGTMPDLTVGYQPVKDPEVVAKFQREWGITLRPERGLDNTQMVGASLEGRLKAIWVTGEEMSLTDANSNYMSIGFEAMEFVVVQELTFTNTCRYADVILPGAASLEKEGTFTNTERRIQRLYEVMPPLRGTKPDWQIYIEVARRMGADWNYAHPSEIMDEIARVSPIYAGVNYERLEGYKTLCWPVAPDGTDTPLLYVNGFNFPDGKARLFPAEFQPRQRPPTAEYDLHLNNGRMLEHFHEGNMTFHTAGITSKAPDTFVEVSPELAAERGVQTGTWVRLVSPDGAVRVRVLVTDRVAGQEVYVPMNARLYIDTVNHLTGLNHDSVTHTPAYKDSSVRMEVLGDVGENPMPRSNPRYGHPTPQRGVEVQRKWAQPGYTMPGEGGGTAD
ncbi:formate dehydrogenase subunit alpha [Deinococcus sp.]|uniref:formate dehydrogenase subunit alpha n=1 Tax=Deinococcus sp. TaxID=47478 RepID=UPI0025B8C530|nr:formate dehydrogenase subunit alpha [Deinococcus sp.]